jgi:CIC family chloride channel protein
MSGLTADSAAVAATGDDRDGEVAEEGGGLVGLALLSLFVGVISGLIGAAFRICLLNADRLRDVFASRAHDYGLAGVLGLMAVCAAATAVAAWLVRRFSPYASGIGIPHVEAVLHGTLPQAPLRLVPVKFVGGVLAIGAGLALGREGPSVQICATASHLIGKLFRRSWPDGQALLAAGAGAGLATAFNAPIAGAVFVIEELVRRFDTRVMIATCGASAGAIGVARFFLGQAPDFDVDPLPYPVFGTLPFYLVLGLIAGVLGVAYNRAILGALAKTESFRHLPVELRAGMIGAAVGLLAWFVPEYVGGGDAITEATLTGHLVISLLPPVFLLRFCLGATSYAAGTPGGLFAPMLVRGSQMGLMFGTLCCRWFPDVALSSMSFAVIGMAAFFTAVVRAPLTGIILAVELTGGYTQLLPLLAASFTAMLVPTLLGNAPIYDSLRLSSERAGDSK